MINVKRTSRLPSILSQMGDRQTQHAL